jgi:hypothetical protein
MRNGTLAVRRVGRYRGACYPSRRPESAARRGGSIGLRALRAAAAPAAAIGLGAAGCDGGLVFTGDLSDATDAADPDHAVLCEDYTLTSPVAVGDCYVRYLTEAEGRALIEEVVRDDGTTARPAPCPVPTLTERLLVDVPFPPGGAIARIDLLAPATSAEETPPCPGVDRPAVGFEFMTDEAGDDEDFSGNPEGLSDADEAHLATLRARREAAIAPFRASDYPYRVVRFIDDRIDDTDRFRAEDLLRDAVRGFLDDLRRDGMI